MTQICGKYQKYVGKWLKFLTSGYEYVGNDFEIWEMAKIFNKGLRYMFQGNVVHMWKMA